MIRLLAGDNLVVMGELQERPIRFALAYLDPPFFTQRTHATSSGEVAFEDRWPNLGAWTEQLARVALAAWRLLVPGGSLVLHVDPKTSHYAKCALDGVFGRAAFASELVWRYRRWPTKTPNFQRVHDVLLRWVRPDGPPRFCQLYEPLSPKTIETHGTAKQKASWSDGKARRLPTRLLDEESPGVPLGDVWEIGIIAPSANERTGFPTQKPEKLLERLVGSLTLPGDAVLDPYAGSGTTLAVGMRMGRDAVGIDSSPVAIRVASERLAKQHGRPMFDAAGGAR